MPEPIEVRAGGGARAWLVTGNQGPRGRLLIAPDELVCSFGALGPHRIARRSTTAVRLERLGSADLVAVERVGGARESLAITVPRSVGLEGLLVERGWPVERFERPPTAVLARAIAAIVALVVLALLVVVPFALAVASS